MSLRPIAMILALVFAGVVAACEGDRAGENTAIVDVPTFGGGPPGGVLVALVDGEPDDLNPLTYVVRAERALFAGDLGATVVLQGFVAAALVALVGVLVGARTIRGGTAG